MELKRYQKDALDELSLFLSVRDASNDAPLADVWRTYWNERGFNVRETEGERAVPRYVEFLPNVPRVCLKIPTGGGKTFVACAALKRLFGDVPACGAPRMVVWLVPSDAILEQTTRTLSNPSHPYRMRLDSDFAGRVDVLTKEQLLAGQNFSPDTVCETTTIFVASYASLRIDKKKKEARKAYQENGALYRFELEKERFETFAAASPLTDDVSESSLIATLRRLRPVVIVDESHNATSDLSVEMLKNLNPSFVLELTATPRESSNIVSYVDALALKREDMVKLPVIVRRCESKNEVVENALLLRARLEERAKKEEEENGAPYLRPIVLFQAQPNAKEDAETFEKIRADLEASGVPKEWIAVKTSKIDDLKGVDLLSRDCPIRCAITVNALREGWDCPFAYILASLANKSSVVDVEQILGRILRLPGARRRGTALLNDSFVFTSSNEFNATVEKIVAGLNRAGFGKECVKIAEPELLTEAERIAPPIVRTLPFEPEPEVETDADILRPDAIKIALNSNSAFDGASRLDELERAVELETDAFEAATQEEERQGIVGGELAKMTKSYPLNPAFAPRVENLRLPQFFFADASPNLFGEYDELLTRENLTSGFSLRAVDAEINFALAKSDARTVDVDSTAKVKIGGLSNREERELRRSLATLPPNERVVELKARLRRMLNKSDVLAASDVRDYVDRVVAKMEPEVLETMETELVAYVAQIEKKIDVKLREHRKKRFERLVDSGEIVCRPSYSFPKSVAPRVPTTRFKKTLYEAESGCLNDLECELAFQASLLENVEWIHRVEERKGFCLNGFLNHYPDFIVATKRGTVVLAETKGEHLANDESADKLALGRAWQRVAGSNYRYFMIFKNKALAMDGAYVVEDFIDVLKRL